VTVFVQQAHAAIDAELYRSRRPLDGGRAGRQGIGIADQGTAIRMVAVDHLYAYVSPELAFCLAGLGSLLVAHLLEQVPSIEVEGALDRFSQALAREIAPR